ncbi:MAG: tetratricopeptide (TPR) repeat protein [Ancylomarina sp.]|jgi:tetratricopeptide (TPR) repeat protein
MPFFRLLIICFVFSYGSVCAQDFMRVSSDEFTGGADKGKMMKNIKKAKKLFENGESSFSECINLLLECNAFNSSNAELNYNIGQAYLMYGKKDLAKPYFEEVKILKPNFNEILYLLLGQACQYDSDFSKAILNYKIYVEILQHEGTKRNKEKLENVNRYIGQCKSGQILSEQLTDFDVEKLASPINSESNDVLAIKDGSKLFFNSDRLIISDKKKERSSLRGFSVMLMNGEWTNFSILNDDEKSRDLPLMVAKLNANQYLFYDKNIGLGDLIFMQKDDQYWTKEMDVFFVNEKKSNESSASFTSDGNTVVFVSDRDGGQGDIFHCEKGANGEWSKPIKLGDQINSTFEEKDVYLSEDGKVIYFSSKGRNSIGGYDIFKSTKDDSGSWMEAQNMGMPINSAYDECHFLPSEGGSFLFDSNRGENGKFDIYTKKLIVKKVIQEELEEAVEPVEKLKESIPAVILLPVPVVTKVATILTTYKVQVAASKLEMKESELKKIYRGKAEIIRSYDGEWYRYTIGDYANVEDAIYFRDRSGVEKAFIVSFENDARKKVISNYSLSNY